MSGEEEVESGECEVGGEGAEALASYVSLSEGMVRPEEERGSDILEI